LDRSHEKCFFAFQVAVIFGAQWLFGFRLNPVSHCPGSGKRHEHWGVAIPKVRKAEGEEKMTHAPMGCFLIGVTGPGFNPNGEALIGSVSDDPYDVRTFLRLVKPTGSQAHIGTELVSTTEHTLVERGYFAGPGETTRGINERGLAFTCAMIFEHETAERTLRAAVFADLTRKMMTTCATVVDAINLFQSAGATAPAYSMLLADAKGDLAHVETGSFGVNVNHHYSKQHPGAVFAVNCYLSQEFVRYNAPNSVIENTQNNNPARRERGKELAQEMHGNLDVVSLARILSDHTNGERDPMDNPLLEAWGYSICNHGTRHQETYPHERLPWGTVSAEIMQPAKKLFWYAYGWPCGRQPEYGDQIHQEKSWGKFVPFGFEARDAYEEETTILATSDGEITVAGSRSQADLDPAVGNR
jgi:acyl-CoA:6-aminopenicillanic acid acyl transferase